MSQDFPIYMEKKAVCGFIQRSTSPTIQKVIKYLFLRSLDHRLFLSKKYERENKRTTTITKIFQWSPNSIQIHASKSSAQLGRI